MIRKSIIWGFIVLGCTVQAVFATLENHPPEYMNKDEREALKKEARDMFYHAYNAYMDNAYPADELMPLSCKGRYRNSEPDRGDIDSTLGNFSLTLVDTLDTLVVLGDLEEFENAVRLVVKDVTFDTDVIVSLFETNIRMLGGLLSGHILAEYLQSRAEVMPWYRGELLNLAKDLGYRFLPAFNTTTGIPFGRINLRNGMKGVPAEMCRETCTACAGSMILEMAALSRLTGEPIFEEKAQKAMDALWKMRHRGTDLMGSVLNVHSGDWVRRDSGVGAGIDSYYEYCLKAYILLGDEKYLGRFNKHYQAVMKYVSQGPMLLDVHMHRPNTNSKNFMDALLAFWPGLQVLKGDIKPAVETHEMLYQVMQRHNFIPEAFTTDFQVHWGHHPLRPEFLESTYFLYRATGDHYYLGVGRKVLKSLQTYAKVPCGYAAMSDVRTNKHDDTMDSFVLSETLKYLYLLFAEPSDLILDIDEFIFTTEGHLLPLTLAAVRSNITSDLDRDIVQVDELGRTCPNSLHLFPASVRQPLRNMVEDVCPRRNPKRRLSAYQFQTNNLEHLKILSNMGITVLTPSAGQVRVLHTFSNARSAQDAEEGLLFMQEMVELSKKQSEQPETTPQSVTLFKKSERWPREITLMAGPAHFGPKLKDDKRIVGLIEYANPSDACSDLVDPKSLKGKIVVVSRGYCMFVEKARRIQKAGAIAGIVRDNTPGSSAADSPMFAMSGDGRDDITIPVVFLFDWEATHLMALHIAGDLFAVAIGDYSKREDIQLNSPTDQTVLKRLKDSFNDFLSRVVRPENTASRETEVSASRETENSATDNVQSRGTQPPMVVKLPHCHLKATVFEELDIARIERSEIPPPPRKSARLQEYFEKKWRGEKQQLVTKVYSSESHTHNIFLTMLRYQYLKLQKLRGLNIPDSDQPVQTKNLVEWFLQELCDLGPLRKSNINQRKKDSQDVPSEEKIEKLPIIDVDRIMNLWGIEEDWRQEIEAKRKLENEENPIPSLKSQNDINMDEPRFWIFVENYVATFVHNKIRIILFRTTNTENSSVNKETELKRPKIEPASWSRFQQYIVNSIYSTRVVEVSISGLTSQYNSVQTLRGVYAPETIEGMVKWYLKELTLFKPTKISPLNNDYNIKENKDTIKSSLVSETVDGRLNDSDNEMSEKRSKISEADPSETNREKNEKSENNHKFDINSDLKIIEYLREMSKRDSSKTIRQAGDEERANSVTEFFESKVQRGVDVQAILRDDIENGKALLRKDKSKSSDGPNFPVSVKGEEKSASELLENAIEQLESLGSMLSDTEKLFEDVVDEWKRFDTIFLLGKTNEDKSSVEKSENLRNDLTETKKDDDTKTKQASKHINDEL